MHQIQFCLAYHAWIRLLHGWNPQRWDFFERVFERGPINVAALKSIYKTWKDMDLYLVGLLEKVDRYLNGRRKQVHA